MPEVVLPVLDEAEALPWVVSRMPDGFVPIVVDNGCTDGSPEIARALGVRVVSEPRRGFGAACFAGLSASTSDVICFIDCDASCDPAELPRLAEPVELGDADLVLGSRVPERGAWPLHARLANRVLAMEVLRRTGVRLSDLGPMRVTRRQELIALGMRDRAFGWSLEMVLRAIAAGWRIQEMPVRYLERSGRSKVTGTLRGTWRTVNDMAQVLTALGRPR
jgi:glycosyltransferase involved in cell wall biosynthesis